MKLLLAFETRNEVTPDKPQSTAWWRIHLLTTIRLTNKWALTIWMTAKVTKTNTVVSMSKWPWLVSLELVLESMSYPKRRERRRRRRERSQLRWRILTWESSCLQELMVVLLNLNQRDKVSSILLIWLVVCLIWQHQICSKLQARQILRHPRIMVVDGPVHPKEVVRKKDLVKSQKWAPRLAHALVWNLVKRRQIF